MSERLPASKKIGEFLKQKREAIHESLAEVSGAVEIDLDMLHKIETGRLLPSEDILLLLISHLNVEEQDAMRLLDIAGYDRDSAPSSDEAMRQTFMVIPFDNRIMYADEVQVRSDKNGVVFEFMQASSNGQKTAVSRVGLSREHAAKMLGVAAETIKLSAEHPVQKQLPMPKSQKRSKQS